VLTDHRTCARNEKQKVKEKVGKLSDVKLLPIAIGRHVNLKELQKINNGCEVPMFGEYEDPEKVGRKIIQGAYMLGSISSRCSGKEPELGFVRSTPKKFETGVFITRV